MSKTAEEYSKEFDSMYGDHTPDLPVSKSEQEALERFPVDMIRIPCRKKNQTKQMNCRDFMETKCIRLKRGVCRLDMKPCRERCPLHKTKEEMEQQRKSNV